MADLNEIGKKRVVYTIPGMERANVRKDLTYKTVDGMDLKMDVYYPEDRLGGTRYPAVILVHGDGPPEWLRDAKEWGVFVSFGQLLAASGLVAVTFNHRGTERLTKVHEVASDIDDLINYVRTQADELQIEKDMLCIWTFSAGVPLGLRSAMRDSPAFVRGIVAYYGPLNLQRRNQYVPDNVSDELVREFSPLHYLEQYGQQIAPMFIARAGLDRPGLNATIDDFMAKALALNVAVTLVNHPQGHHGFDVLDDDERSREIIRQTLDFVKTRLESLAQVAS